MTDLLRLTTGVVYLQSAVPINGTVITSTRDAIATTSTDGFVIANTTASTAAIPVQQSPRLRFRSNVWNTTVTAANNTDDWWIESVPVSGTTPYGQLQFYNSANGAAGVKYADLTANGHFGVTGGGRFYFIGSTLLSDISDGVMTIRTNSGGAGVALSVATDTIFKVRTRANTAYATVDALAYQINGSGGATSLGRVTKKVTGIGDAAATTVFTVTVPNANHAASIKLRFLASNGSTDAFESSRTAEGTVVLARTTGVDTIATVVAISDEAIATVAAGATHTLAYSATGMTGAADATQTFDIQVTINDTGNLGSNQVVAVAELLNAEATGCTIA